MTQDRDKWQIFVKKVMKSWVPVRQRKFLSALHVVCCICNCICTVFIVCSGSFIVFVVLCNVFCLRVIVLFCVMCVICVLCHIVVPFPPRKNPYAVKVNK
jgi:hypothetical protein